MNSVHSAVCIHYTALWVFAYSGRANLMVTCASLPDKLFEIGRVSHVVNNLHPPDTGGAE